MGEWQGVRETERRKDQPNTQGAVHIGCVRALKTARRSGVEKSA